MTGQAASSQSSHHRPYADYEEDSEQEDCLDDQAQQNIGVSAYQPELTGRLTEAHEYLDDKEKLTLGKMCSEVLFFPCHLATKIRFLSGRFGAKFLFMVVAIQWLQKGFGFGLLTSTLRYIYRDIGNISASELGVYIAVATAPFAAKPLMGIQADFWQFYGWQKYPLLMFWNVVGIIVSAYVFFTWNQTKTPLSAEQVTICAILYVYFVANSDLLVEAVASMKIRQDSKNGPSLVSFLWAGNFATSILVAWVAGEITEKYSSWYAWLFLFALAILAYIPTFLNWVGEKQSLTATQFCLHFNTEKYGKEKNLFWMAVLSSLAAIGFVLMGFVPKEYVKYQMPYTMVAGTVLMIASYLYLPKWIYRTCLLNFTSGILSPSVGSASYYFYTDSEEEYKDGPHFSPRFYISTIGVVGGVMNVLGIILFDRFMKSWPYRSVLIVANLLVSLCNVVNILIYTRQNLLLGIPDMWFVLGEDVFSSMLQAWTWIPSVLILSQLCPKGTEASSFAITAGIANLGWTASGFAGSWLLALFSVEPSGAKHEDAQFENLWKASLIASILPIATIAMIPFCVPPGRMTDDLSHLLQEEEEEQKSRHNVARHTRVSSNGISSAHDTVNTPQIVRTRPFRQRPVTVGPPEQKANGRDQDAAGPEGSGRGVRDGQVLQEEGNLTAQQGEEEDASSTVSEPGGESENRPLLGY